MEYPIFEKCSSCKKPMVKIVRLNEKGGETLIFSYVCTNPDCVLRINLDEVKNWGKSYQ